MVSLAPRLVARASKLAVGVEDLLAVALDGARGEPAIGIDDAARSGPLDAALEPGSVADGHPDLAHMRGRLREGDLHGPLILRARKEREIRRQRDEVGTGQREPARELREVEVIADRDADPPERRLDHGRLLPARLEAELLAVPEMRLAVHREETARSEDGRRVVDAPVLPELGEATDDDRLAARGFLGPVGELLHGKSERARLLRRLEDVAGRDQLRKQDDARAGSDRLPQSLAGEPAVALGLAHPRGDLRACDPDVVHRPRFTSTPSTRQDPAPWSSPSFLQTSPS